MGSIQKKNEMRLDDVEKNIGYVFKDKSLLITSLTHSSYVNDRKNAKISSNERMEFLGDSVLSLIVTEFLYRNNDGLNEGDMTKMRAMAVCETTLAEHAKALNIGNAMLIGKGEEITNGRNRPSMLADAFEAVLAAIFLDGGMVAAKEFMSKYLIQKPSKKALYEATGDYKTLLQEQIQKTTKEKISYAMASTKGPEHEKMFEYNVLLNDKIVGHGCGKSKKVAEQKAAKQALKTLKT